MSIGKTVLLTFSILFLGLLVYYFYPEQKLQSNIQINKLVVYKSKRQMLAYADGRLLKTYTISLGRQPIGHKEFKGDNKTPEGIYHIYDKNPYSVAHKNLGISYPNKEDIRKAKQLGKPTGGDIKIHGLPNKLGFIKKFHRWFDLTYGCIMVTNQEMDELYNSVKIGTPIVINP